MKRPPFRKVAAYGGGILVALGLLGVAVVVFENHRGQRAWEKYRRDAEARGVKFGVQDFVPPPIPDAENFAAAPPFMRLFEGDDETRDKNWEDLRKRLSLEYGREAATKPKGGWQTGCKVDLAAWGEYLGEPDLRVALKKFEPALAEIAKAAERPGVRFPLDYSLGSMMEMPHLTRIISASNILRLRAIGALANGQPDNALADLQLILRLGEVSTQGDAIAITALVQISVVGIGLQPVWEGLAAHQWTEDQLRLLQERLQRTDLLAMSRLAFERERLGCSLGLDKFLSTQGVPRVVWGVPWPPNVKAVYYQNLLLSDRLFESYLLPSIDVAVRRVNPVDELPELMAKYGSRFPLYTMLAKMTHSTMGAMPVRVAAGQTYLDEAVIACALERHRLREGKFPEHLDALVPRYLAKLPHDLLTGEPLRYRLTEDGGYLLYSVGKNGTDDGGIIATKENGSVDVDNGDWVWKMPETLPSTIPTTTPSANATPAINPAASVAPAAPAIPTAP